MSTEYLNKSGLSYFWGKIKAYVSGQRDIWYGTCSTAKATVQKEVSISGITALTEGLTISVKFTATNTATDPTLKLNTLDAKAIKRYGTTAPGTSAAGAWNAGEVVTLTYDGTYWQMHDFNNTTYSSMSSAEVTAGTGTTARVITPARLKEGILTWAQEKLVSGTNIKTINNESLLGSGNITVGGGGGGGVTGVKGNSESTYRTGNVNLTAANIGAQETLVSGTNIKTINNTSLLGSGNISVGGSSYTITTDVIDSLNTLYGDYYGILSEATTGHLEAIIDEEETSLDYLLETYALIFLDVFGNIPQ